MKGLAVLLLLTTEQRIKLSFDGFITLAYNTCTRLSVSLMLNLRPHFALTFAASSSRGA